MFVLFMLAYAVFYIYPNFYAPWQPHMLPLLPIDQNTPFLPWTFILYTSDYYLFLFVILMHKEKESFNSFCRMAFVTLFICGAFFLFFPTTYPRPQYPEVDNWFIAFLMNLIAVADTPNNCFPSMHVALTGVATWSFRDRGPKVFGFLVVWTLLIYASTLTTKQHYFMDIVGGIGVIVFVAILERTFQKIVLGRLIHRVPSR